MLSDPEDIRNEWKNYFETLYTPKEGQFDNQFNKHVKYKMEEMEKESTCHRDNILNSQISVNEVKQVIKGLKTKKAPGIDNIQAECYKYGGKCFIECITKLFNLLCNVEYVPSQFKKGVIIPIPKGDKDKSLKDNYRGITLLPVMSKIFEKCIIVRIEKWSKDHKIINEQQGASHEKCSSLHVAWLVKEAIARYNEKGSTVYLSMLDTKKAYDSVWQSGLFYMLYEYGINAKAWRVLRNFYSVFICYVRINSKLSEGFEALQGIHQGAPCSMFLFQLFTSKLLHELANSMYSLNIYGVKLCCAAFADDLTVLAVSPEALQAILDICYKYSFKWHFQFNPSKCSIMTFGKESKKNLLVKFKLGKISIERSKCEILLGTVLSNNKNAAQKCYRKRISSCKTMLYAAQSIGSYVVPLSPVTAKKLYWSSCVPKLMYGMECENIDDDTMIEIEKFHCKAAKHCQGLPNNTSNCGAIITVGWQSLSSYRDTMLLLFFWKILLLPMECIYKRMLIFRLTYIFYNVDNRMLLGPTKIFVDTCVRYGLLKMLKESVMSGVYIGMKEWKKNVNKVSLLRDQQKKDLEYMFYKVLDYLNVTSYSMSAWWHHAHLNPTYSRKVRSVIRVLLNVDRMGLKVCEHCEIPVIRSIEHVLFQCYFMRCMREKLWSLVTIECPKQLRDEMNMMTDKERSIFILNCFNCKYISEWRDIYSAVINFIYYMWKEV